MISLENINAVLESHGDKALVLYEPDDYLRIKKANVLTVWDNDSLMAYLIYDYVQKTDIGKVFSEVTGNLGSGSVLYVIQVAVHKDHTKKGFSHLLLSYIESLDAPEVVGVVLSGSVGECVFKRRGYSYSGSICNYDGDGMLYSIYKK